MNPDSIKHSASGIYESHWQIRKRIKYFYSEERKLRILKRVRCKICKPKLNNNLFACWTCHCILFIRWEKCSRSMIQGNREAKRNKVYLYWTWQIPKTSFFLCFCYMDTVDLYMFIYSLLMIHSIYNYYSFQFDFSSIYLLMILIIIWYISLL